jgi:glycerate 2-kinase
MHNQYSISAELFSNRIMKRNQKLGSDACEILSHAIQAVDAYECVFRKVVLDGNRIQIDNQRIDLNNFDRISIIGFGKAAAPMAKAVIDKLEGKIYHAYVVTKDSKFLAEDGYLNKMSVYLGGHPIPSDASIKATQQILQSLPKLTQKDLVLVMISGGGSALFTEPVSDVSLSDMQILTQMLLKCGADIYEINTLRKHLDLVKGGRLAERLQPASVQVLILSDVIGDRLDMIASGPTVPDPTTFQDALNILDRYDIKSDIPLSILLCLEKGREGVIPETLKPGVLSVGLIGHHLVGSNYLAAAAARRHADTLGYYTEIISTTITERTDVLADYLNGVLQSRLSNRSNKDQPVCLIFGGEPTVKVRGDGVGGRNMDLTLRMVPKLAGIPGVLFISFATDGEDGPTDAAGAAADDFVFDEGKDVHGLGVQAYIENSDSYRYFDRLGGLIKTGSTGTNVNDLILILINEQTSRKFSN